MMINLIYADSVYLSRVLSNKALNEDRLIACRLNNNQISDNDELSAYIIRYYRIIRRYRKTQ